MTAEAANNPTDAKAPVAEPAAPVSADAGKPGNEQPPAADPKPADTLLGSDPKPNADDKPAEPKPAEGAPEKYEFKAPEGQEYDAKVVESFSEAAKKANLTQEKAQALLDEMSPVLAARTAEQVQAVQNGWVEASKTDKEFGGEKLQENLAICKKAMDEFATPETRKLLEDTGLGNHPEVIRLLFRVGKAISEDKVVTGSGPGSGTVDAAKVLYNNTPTKE